MGQPEAIWIFLTYALRSRKGEKKRLKQKDPSALFMAP